MHTIKAICIFCFFVMISLLFCACGNHDIENNGDQTISNDDMIVLYCSKEENIATDLASGTSYVDNEIIVALNDEYDRQLLEYYVEEIGGTIEGKNEFINSYQIVLDKEYSLEEINEIIRRLEEQLADAEISPNYCIEVGLQFYPNDSKWADKWSTKAGGLNWGAEAIKAPEMWDVYQQLPHDRINVGVLDNQFYTEHEDLDFVDTFMNDFDMGIDGYCHGTHVAGTIAATFNNNKGIAGIAPEVNLYGVSLEGLLNRTNLIEKKYIKVTISEYETGLVYLIAKNNCKVINLSYGGGLDAGSKPFVVHLEMTLQKLIDNGYDFLICKGAGNDFMDYDDYDMLSLITKQDVMERIITVGAAELDDGGRFHIAPYSNYGPSVDLIAPGTDIYSTYCTKNSFRLDFWNSFAIISTYKEMYGTSMATPHVSGVAATIWSTYPSLTGPEVKQIICESATGSYGYNPEYEHVSDNNTEYLIPIITSADAYMYLYPMLNGYEAIKLASETIASNSDNNQDVFSEIEGMAFNYASGAGAWGTKVVFESDGTFSGSFHDTNMGDIGDNHPNGTLLLCNFSGRFKITERVDDYSYVMELENLIIEEPTTETIENGVKIIPSDPYGIEGGKAFMLFLPGASVADYPHEYADWIQMSSEWSSDETFDDIPFYGLFNVEEKKWFWSLI